MGRLIPDTGKRDWDDLNAENGTQLMGGLSVRAICAAVGAGHMNVLQHLMGYPKNRMISEDRGYCEYTFLRLMRLRTIGMRIRQPPGRTSASR